jgi:hypothetical protein
VKGDEGKVYMTGNMDVIAKAKLVMKEKKIEERKEFPIQWDEESEKKFEEQKRLKSEKAKAKRKREDQEGKGRKKGRNSSEKDEKEMESPPDPHPFPVLPQNTSSSSSSSSSTVPFIFEKSAVPEVKVKELQRICRGLTEDKLNDFDGGKLVCIYIYLFLFPNSNFLFFHFHFIERCGTTYRSPPQGLHAEGERCSALPQGTLF